MFLKVAFDCRRKGWGDGQASLHYVMEVCELQHQQGLIFKQQNLFIGRTA